jgi:hypothetical protein
MYDGVNLNLGFIRRNASLIMTLNRMTDIEIESGIWNQDLHNQVNCTVNANRSGYRTSNAEICKVVWLRLEPVGGTAELSSINHHNWSANDFN